MDVSRDPFAAPDELELPYIPPQWRPFAVRADSLVIDVDDNVKLHADKDLSAQQESLKSWGFTRQVIVRRANRQIIIGNGSVLAAIRNGWEYVPADFRDLTEDQARALGAADNMLGTLADWNEAQVAKLLEELPALDLPDMTLDVAALCGDLLQCLDVIEDPAAAGSPTVTPATAPGEQPAASPAPAEAMPPTDAEIDAKAADVLLVHRAIVILPNEETQVRLVAEMITRGYDCRVSTVRAN